MDKTYKVFDDLEKLANLVPTALYWTDRDAIILGVNQYSMRIGKDLSSQSSFIGKGPYDMYPTKIADMIYNNTREVIQTGETHVFKEMIPDVTTGRTRYYTATRSPLFDEAGTVIGIVGTVFESTAEKEAEHLKQENELQKVRLQEQEKFTIAASQVAHDIRSPLSSLSMIVKSCKSMPKAERIALRDVATGISDIANNLLNYKKGKNRTQAGARAAQPILLSLALSEILSEKRYQYKDSPVKFHYTFAPNSSFAFIKIDLSSFNRMLSNIINNAVDAFEGKKGEVNLELSVVGEQVKLTIQDNGKGMPQTVIDKIMNNIAVSSGKKDGNGIGMAQIRSVLQSSNSKMAIESQIGKGTKITLTFSRVATASWIAEEIDLTRGDLVVVLDDDYSIHEAWEMCFKPYKSLVKLQHFESGQDMIKFINELPVNKKEHLFLLVDFELIDQELNGLQIIEQLRSLLTL